MMNALWGARSSSIFLGTKMDPLSRDEKELIHQYRQLSTAHQSALLAFIAAAIRLSDRPSLPHFSALPHINQRPN